MESWGWYISCAVENVSMSYYKKVPSNVYTFIHHCFICETMQLNDIFVLINNHCGNKEFLDPGDFPAHSILLHGENFYDAAENWYSIDKYLKAVDKVRQLTASRRYVDKQVLAKLNERGFDVDFVDYVAKDDWKEVLRVLYIYIGSFHGDQLLMTKPQSLIKFFWLNRSLVFLRKETTRPVDAVDDLLRPSFSSVSSVSIVRAITDAWSFALFQNNIIGNLYCVLSDHVTWDGN